MIGRLFAYFGWNALICQRNNVSIMLGIDSKELPVVKRAHTGKLNEADKKTIARSAKILEEFVVVKE